MKAVLHKNIDWSNMNDHVIQYGIKVLRCKVNGYDLLYYGTVRILSDIRVLLDNQTQSLIWNGFCYKTDMYKRR